MDILISNSSGQPIYDQISAQIKNQILTKKLSPGEPLPSMRVLARELHVSIITTKRAYEELEREGLIESYTGKGSFVKAQGVEQIKEQHLRILEKKVELLAAEAKAAGVSLEELKDMLELLYEGNE